MAYLARRRFGRTCALDAPFPKSSPVAVLGVVSTPNRTPKLEVPACGLSVENANLFRNPHFWACRIAHLRGVVWLGSQNLAAAA